MSRSDRSRPEWPGVPAVSSASLAPVPRVGSYDVSGRERALAAWAGSLRRRRQDGPDGAFDADLRQVDEHPDAAEPPRPPATPVLDAPTAPDEASPHHCACCSATHAPEPPAPPAPRPAADGPVLTPDWRPLVPAPRPERPAPDRWTGARHTITIGAVELVTPQPSVPEQVAPCLDDVDRVLAEERSFLD